MLHKYSFESKEAALQAMYAQNSGQRSPAEGSSAAARQTTYPPLSAKKLLLDDIYRIWDFKGMPDI